MLAEFFATGINSFYISCLLFVSVLSRQLLSSSWGMVWILTDSDNEEFSVLVLLVKTFKLLKTAEIQDKT